MQGCRFLRFAKKQKAPAKRALTLGKGLDERLRLAPAPWKKCPDSGGAVSDKSKP